MIRGRGALWSRLSALCRDTLSHRAQSDSANGGPPSAGLSELERLGR